MGTSYKRARSDSDKHPQTFGFPLSSFVIHQNIRSDKRGFKPGHDKGVS